MRWYCWADCKKLSQIVSAGLTCARCKRRVQQWRGIMSKELVYATAGEPMAGTPCNAGISAGWGWTPSAKVSVTFLNEATGIGIFS